MVVWMLVRLRWKAIRAARSSHQSDGLDTAIGNVVYACLVGEITIDCENILEESFYSYLRWGAALAP